MLLRQSAFKCLRAAARGSQGLGALVEAHAAEAPTALLGGWRAHHAAAAAVSLTRMPPQLPVPHWQQPQHQQQQQQRGYAKAAGVAKGMPKGSYAIPAGAERGGNVRVAMVSPNLLAEPYKGEPTRLPFLRSWFTPTGWKERWQRTLNGAKSMYSLSKCKKNIPDWKLPEFKQESLQLYREICERLAEGDRTGLRQLVTPAMFADMKRQLRQREEGGWRRVRWEMASAPTLKEMELVQGRLIALDPKDDNSGWAQLTVRIPSKQRFAAYDARGNVVAGSLHEDITVVDLWVFEHALKPQPTNRWRLAARLGAMAPPQQEGQQQEQRQQAGQPRAPQQQRQQQARAAHA